MAYTTTKYFSPRAFAFPGGFDNTQKLVWVRGQMMDCDTATYYSPGGIGSTSFEVTAFSATGLVTYSGLLGAPLVNGARVVIYNTGSNTNDGTYIVSQLAASTTSAGTFVAVAIPGETLAGSGQTAQTAEGVGQINFGQRAFLSQTFTATAVTWIGGVSTITYTTFTGPQLHPGDQVTIAGMTNAGNNGTFAVVAAYPTSSTAGSFTINNVNGVASDSGSGTGQFKTGIDAYNSSSAPVLVKFFSTSGQVYQWDFTNQTIRILGTGAAQYDALNEMQLGATANQVSFDSGLYFEALLLRARP